MFFGRTLVWPTDLCLVWASLAVSLESCFQLFCFTPQRKTFFIRVICLFKCALCVLHQSVWNTYECEVCMYAWTGFICDSTSHTYSQLGKLVQRGNKSCNLLILLGAFTSLNKNSVISAFMGFIWHITIPCPRRWSSQRVKWREGRSDTQTLPPPSLSPPISLTSWSPLLSLTLRHFILL